MMYGWAGIDIQGKQSLSKITAICVQPNDCGQSRNLVPQFLPMASLHAVRVTHLVDRRKTQNTEVTQWV